MWQCEDNVMSRANVTMPRPRGMMAPTGTQVTCGADRGQLWRRPGLPIGATVAPNNYVAFLTFSKTKPKFKNS